MWWTASVNIYQNGDTVKYSVRMWRVGENARTFVKPDVRFTGSMPAPLSEHPTTWLRHILERLPEKG